MLLGRTCINSTRKFKSISPTIFRSASKVAREMKIENENFGKYYDDMRYIWRQKNRPPIVVLRNLLLAIEKEEHGKFAVLGVQWFQDKGMDFDKEVANLFVKKCLLTNKSKEAAILISKWKNRISAWMSVGSTNNLINQLLLENNNNSDSNNNNVANDNDDSDNDDNTENSSLLLAAKVLNIRMRKGLSLSHSETALSAVLTACCAVGLPPSDVDGDNDDDNEEEKVCKVKESYELVMEGVRIVANKEVEDIWRTKYPLESTVIATEEEEAEDEDENEGEAEDTESKNESTEVEEKKN